MEQKKRPATAFKKRVSYLNFEKVFFVFCLLLVGGTAMRMATAATFEPPINQPPGGNIPITIWNRESSTVKQADASIDIDGYIYAEETLGLGSQDLDLGSSTTGQNLIYGFAPYDKMHATGDRLLLLETESGGAWTSRLILTKDGDLTTSGSVGGEGCFGSTLVGLTYTGGTGGGVFPVDELGYFAQNNKCNADYEGSHVCTVEEMLESIKCSKPGDPIRSLEPALAWINGGPPGFTANSNDCIGWTTDASSSYGRYWVFNDATGGHGTMTSCNAPGLKFACCRSQLSNPSSPD